MATTTHIQWTDVTWNIARGCSKVDKDCLFCYMYRESLSGTRYNPMQVVKTKTVFNLPLRIKEPSKIFTSSLTDFFHEDIDSYRHEAWDIIRRCPQHIFQILTKRPERIRYCLPSDWGLGYKNVWLGVSAGTQDGFDKRVPILATIPALVRFISMEPLTEYIDISKALWENNWDKFCTDCGERRKSPCDNYDCQYNYLFRKIQWVILGGESGNDTGKYGYRPCQLDWLVSISNQFASQGVAVFVKQMGTHLAKELKLKDRKGGNIEEWPHELEAIKRREFPK